MAVGFTRLGADMMVVPEGALTNITAALLTVEPTDLVLDQDLFARAAITSVSRAPRRRSRASSIPASAAITIRSISSASSRHSTSRCSPGWSRS